MQLFVASIPEPNVDRRWGEDQPLASVTEARGRSEHAGKLADRCPFVMPMCVENAPPLFRTDADRAASCFLYRASPTLLPEHMNEVLTDRAAAASS